MTSAMSTRTCKPFPEPKEPFVAVPFFGTYATAGAPGGAVDPLATGPTGASGPTGADEKNKKKGKDGKYPPDKYESPPQKTPTVTTPKPTPTPAPTPAPGVPSSGGTAAPSG
jgi:hypothetical protein